MALPRWIRTKPAADVKSGLALTLITLLLWPAALNAEDPATAPAVAPSPSSPPSPAPAPLPDIEARQLSVRVVRHSRSGKVYLFDDLNDTKTRTGKILLLKHDSEQVMAFRVLKLYPANKQFAAKSVRRYGAYQTLDSGAEYIALEKVGDIIPPPPTAQDKADLKELEAPMDTAPPAASPSPEPSPDASPSPPPPTAPGPESSAAKDSAKELKAYDSELDAAASPPPSGAVDSENAKGNPGERPGEHDDESEEDPTANFGAAIEEISPLDHNSQWLSASFGYFNNGGYYFAGGGVRYALSLGRELILRRPHLQDSLAIEGGLFAYKIINFQSTGDAYTVVPLEATLRYNILFSENFGLFFYGGLMQNFVTQVSSGNAATANSLQTILTAAGAGLLFRVGPNWQTRIDLGYDVVDLGLVLRF